MLTALFVKDFAIVRELEITPAPGLTVVSGETGAGKSLLVDALMLLAGARADSAVVRHGAERAELVARFHCEPGTPALAWLQEAMLDEGTECQIRRVVLADGGSRAWINGRPATVGQLAELGALLVEIHGQHEHQALLQRDRQLALLDEFARHEPARRQVRETALRWQELDAEIRRIRARGDSSQQQDYLRHQIDELAGQDLGTDAIEALVVEHRRLSHATTLIEGCARVANLLEDDGAGSLPGLLHAGRHELERLLDHEPGLEAVAALLESAQIQLVEAASSLERVRDGLELDPQRLGALEAQLRRLHELARKHRVGLHELGSARASLENELAALEADGARLDKLLGARAQAAAQWQALAARLSAGRTDAGHRLGEQVSALMQELGMDGGRLEVLLEPRPGPDPHPDGAERVELLVAANPGQPPRALRRVASGGELSRISLAIEVAILGLQGVGTMVFDEVDTGIGGAVAEAVGQRLRALGDERQVLCVTHLAQVAALGHQHLRVTKDSDADGAHSAVLGLDFEARVEELARMLAGANLTQASRKHARHMLEAAGNAPGPAA